MPLLRQFRRHALTTAINLAGLALGVAGFLFVTLYVAGELSVDRGFTAADRLYRIGTILNLPGRGVLNGADAPPPLAALLPSEVPEVEAVARLSQETVALRLDEAAFDEPVLWADPALPALLDFPVREGDPAAALARPDGLVLTPALARKLFGDADPIGRTVRLKDGTALTVGALLETPPESHLHFTALIAEAARGARSWDRGPVQDWPRGGTATYVRLREGADPEAVRARLPGIVERHATGLPPRDVAPDFMKLRLDPVTDIHLRIKAVDDQRPGGDVGTLRVLVGVALLILGIAIVNYASLSTAQAIQRAREVGLRKLAGARRPQLVGLFLGESVALAALATLVGLGLVELLLPAFGELVDRRLSAATLYTGTPLLVLLAVPPLVGALGGLYPALVLSGYRPAEVLKGRVATPGSGRLQGALVVAQFAVSIALVVATLTVQRQVEHARGADLGFDRSALYTVGWLPHGAERARTLKDEALRIPGIEAASLGSIVPANRSESISSVYVVGAGTDHATAPALSQFTADEDFLRTYGVSLRHGPGLPQGWTPPRPVAGAAPPPARYALVTETGAKRLGFADPATAVGALFHLDPLWAERPAAPPTEIVGVIPDLRFRSAREAPEAMLFTIVPADEFLTLRLAPGDPRPALAALDALIDRVYPDEERLKRGFVDQAIDALYRAEERQARVFATFGALAVLLANMGLFGLTALSAARRTKEIGVRRVVGAGVGDILRLLAWRFTRPVLLANLIAWPAAWLLLERWLGQFATRIELGAAPFVWAGAAALAVALATVSTHAVRVALAPPARALRSE